MSNDIYYKKMMEIIETEPDTLRYEIAIQSLKWEDGKKIGEFLNIIIEDEEENYYLDYEFSEFFMDSNVYKLFDKYFKELNNLRSIHQINVPFHQDLKKHLVCQGLMCVCKSIQREVTIEINQSKRIVPPSPLSTHPIF